MFIPLHDANSLRHIKLQYVTIGLIAANVIVFLITAVQSEQAQLATMVGFGYIPITLFSDVVRPDELLLVPDWMTYFTYSFFHGDIWHLGGNMLFLWIFGDNVEDALGHFRYFIFYMLCAAAGAFVHGLAAPDSQAPLIGASGAIAGIVAAYLILHPRVKIWVLIMLRIPLRIPAWVALAFWIGFQFVMFAVAGEDQVSWAAHIGGIVAGAILVLVLRRRGVPLLDSEIVTPKDVRLAAPQVGAPGPAAPSGPWGRQ